MTDATSCEAHIDIAPLDLHATMAQQLLGHFDPTGTRGPGKFEKVHLDIEGRVMVWRFACTQRGVHVRVHGASAEAALATFRAQFPLDDGVGRFHPEHPLLARLSQAYRGMRLLHMPWAFDVAAGVVLQQRVRWQVGYSDFARVARRFGIRTTAGAAFPSALQLAHVSVAAIEALGIDGKRARALRALARLEAARGVLQREHDPQRIRQRLQQLPGIGPWTANMIAGYALGDADAVPVGDLHLPSMVTSVLAGEDEGSDERMLELLEPYRGHRFRVIRLLTWTWRRHPGLHAAMSRQRT